MRLAMAITRPVLTQHILALSHATYVLTRYSAPRFLASASLACSVAMSASWLLIADDSWLS